MGFPRSRGWKYSHHAPSELACYTPEIALVANRARSPTGVISKAFLRTTLLSARRSLRSLEVTSSSTVSKRLSDFSSCPGETTPWPLSVPLLPTVERPTRPTVSKSAAFDLTKPRKPTFCIISTTAMSLSVSRGERTSTSFRW